MKKFKKIVGLVLVLSFATFNVSPAVVSAVDNSKTNICHATGSQNNPWSAIQINTSALQTHLGHGDFLYGGQLKQNGTPANNGNDWCEDHAPVPVSQLSAAKIVCENESDLPNWGAGGPNITAATAPDFLNTHPNCHSQPGWKYQWAPDGTANPGNNIEHAGGAWQTFDENDLPEVPVGKKFWLREELPAGYIHYSGATSNLNSTNAKNSAEFYCNTDVLNYDNYDSVFISQAGKEYHCIAFNVQIDVCPNLEGKQATVPQGMHLNEDKQCVPDTATVHATKVLCDTEWDLPNWGYGGPNIGPNTATDFVAGNSSCRIVPWIFEWAPDGTANPGNNVEVGGGAWTPFSNGTANVPAGSLVWLREQLPSAYHEFSGATTDLDGTNSKRSAEFYCSNDVLNYDNYDKITPVVANTDYYCVGFNTLKPTKADGKVHVFKYIDGVQATIENANSVSFPMFNAPYTQYPYYLGPNSDQLAGDIPYESSTYNIVGGQTYTTQENLDTTLVGSSCSNENNPDYELEGYTTGKTLVEAQNGVKSLTVPEFIIDGDSYVIVWNKKCVDEVIDVCPNIEGNQSEVPQGYHLNEDKQCVPDEQVVDVCLNIDGIQTQVPQGYHADGQNCYPDENQCGEKTLDVVSDDTNTGSATIIGSPNGGWTSIPGAFWIWDTLADFDGGVSQTKSFSKTFNVLGTPLSATLEVAADNAFVGNINGNGSGVIADPTEFNYGSVKTYNDVLQYITTGMNTIGFDVTNFPVAGSTFDNNPAGLIYKLHVVSNDCPTEPTTGTLIVKKVLVDSEAPFSNFNFKVDGGETVAFDSDGQNDIVVNAGAHTVVETAYANYSTTYENCDAVNVPAGGTATCTVTNTYVPIQVDLPACSDGIDNSDEEDSLIDQADPGCHTDGNVNNPESYVPSDTSESNESAVCSDGKDNDSDQLIDSNDPGCQSGEGGSWNPNDTDESNGGGPSITTSGGGGGGGGGKKVLPQGQVLGAATSCDTINKYMRKGYKNDESEVKKLQKFLNEFLKSGLKEDGKFGLTTEKALRKFQVKYPDTVLGPWGFNKSTGILYQTTLTQIKNIQCPELKLPIPKLIPIEINPEAPAKL